jgi:tetratricopeptide (TPR) repeat protein
LIDFEKPGFQDRNRVESASPVSGFETGFLIDFEKPGFQDRNRVESANPVSGFETGFLIDFEKPGFQDRNRVESANPVSGFETGFLIDFEKPGFQGRNRVESANSVSGFETGFLIDFKNPVSKAETGLKSKDLSNMQRALYAIGMTLLFAGSAAHAQDEIRYSDRTSKKEMTAKGSIQEESPAHIVYKPAGGVGTKEIPALEIVDVVYEVPIAVKFDYGRARADERQMADSSAKEGAGERPLREALKNYQALLPKLSADKSKFARRHVQYKIARLLARQAEDDPDQGEAAVAALTAFQKEHPDSWQITPSAKLLARLQIDRGETDAAVKTYEQLAATPNIPDEVKQECDLLESEALIRGKKFPEAEQKLKALLKKSSGDELQAIRIRIYLAECQGAAGKLSDAVAQLDRLIAQTPDRTLKALAYNAMGDCYRLNGKSRDALWSYLWVDVIYPQDRDEHTKALDQLAKLFEEQGDKSRAKQYREKLKRESK